MGGQPSLDSSTSHRRIIPQPPDGLAAPTTYTDARQCIRDASANMRRARKLLSQPSDQSAEESSALLRQVEIQLGCACAILGAQAPKPDLEMQSALQEMQRETAILAQFFAQAGELLDGWLRAMGSRHAGYTTQGQAAALVLVKKVSVEG